MAKAVQLFSMFVFATIFAVILFFIFKGFFGDVVSYYINAGINAALDVYTLGNAWVFITTAALTLVIFLAILLSGIDRYNAIFALFLSAFITLMSMTMISYIFLLEFYPDQFSGVNIFQIFAGFNYYNMLYMVYVLKSQDTYYIIVFIMLITETFLFIVITEADTNKPNRGQKDVITIGLSGKHVF